MTPLAGALARLVSRDVGLHVMYLPDDLKGLAEEVVRAANEWDENQPDPYPFAIVVDDHRAEDVGDPDCRRVSMGTAISYRRGPRLAVVNGSHTVTQSFSSAFAKVTVGYDYPGAGSTRATTLEELASAVIADVGARYPGAALFLDYELASSRLATVFRTLCDAYEALAQGTVPWNVYWIRHIRRGLSSLFEGIADSGGEEANQLLESITFAAFGLPRPANGTSYAKGRRVEEALVEHWASREAIHVSLGHLRSHPSRPKEDEGTPHPLEEIDFSTFDQRVAAEDNLLLAWGAIGDEQHAATRLEAFAALTETQFFSPLQGFSDTLEVQTPSREAVDVGGGSSAKAVFFTADADLQSLTSERLELTVEAHLADPAVDLAASGVKVLIAGKGQWVGEAFVREGQLVLAGSIELPLVSRKKMPTGPLVLSVEVPANDVLSGLVGKPTSAPIYPVVLGTVGAWVFEASNGGYRVGKYHGYETLSEACEDAGLDREIDDAAIGSKAKVLLWGDPVGATLPLAHVRDGQASLSIVRTEPDLVRSGDDTLKVGNLSLRWVEREADEAFQSPLVAAAQNGSISSAEPESKTQATLRGRLETYIAAALGTPAFDQALGHMAMFEDSRQVPNPMEPVFGGSVLVPSGSAADFTAHINFNVSAELRGSEPAERFRRAVNGLGIAEALSSSGTGVKWLSRTSWEHLHGSAELDEYLEAYTALVEHAGTGSSRDQFRDQFWAAFPFSLAVYPRTGASDARAVLLSPLHPLRLAWLAGAEAALRASKHSTLLAGILEGWNLPVVGPQPNSQNGRLVAIPVDAGHGQLFLGWSMLVKVSVAGAESLEPPSRIGAIQAPGTSVTGLNSDGVRSALRTFQRMNPHVATLSLDLASSLPSARLEEIDEAIVGAIATTASSDSLRGGVRVFDSLNRLGDPPLAELEQKVGAADSRPVRWTRYKGEIGAAPRSNLRFLQDAGVKVEVTATDVRGTGLLGGVPLRRIIAPAQTQASADMAVAYPVVEPGNKRSSFVAALGAVERASAGVAVGVEMFKAALVNSSADWTVTGESLLGASALADLLATDGAGQMLWEWRPPYLGTRTSPRLDARPFVSVVRVPPAFEAQVGRSVAKALGARDGEDVSGSVQQVMRTLGTRGIGLSTLMAQGGTHAAGAIGFYLSLRLIEVSTLDGYDLLVLPIDACDDFLKALAGETASTNQLRRADLLVLAVRGTDLVLVPIEIKSYGLEAEEPHNLPTTPSGLADPLDQLESTTALLSQVVGARAAVEGSDELSAALWRHGLAAMVEAAMRLRPQQTETAMGARELLRAVLEGRANLQLGRSLVCFFGHGATTSSGGQYVVLRDLRAASGDPALPSSGALVANTQVAMETASSGTGVLVDEWAELLGWAISNVAEGSGPIGGSASTGADDIGAAAEDPEVTSDTSADTDTAVAVGSDDRAEVTTVRVDGASEQEIDESRPDTIVGDGVRFSLGKVLGGFAAGELEYWPSNTALNQLNVGVVGDLGTGKTQFLRAMIRQIRLGAAKSQPSPVSMLVFDYKRDYQDDDFLEDVGGRLLRPYQIPLDVLAISGDYTPQKAVQSGGAFLDVLSKIYGGIGPVQRNNLLVIIKDLFAGNRGNAAPTIGEIHSAYQEAHGTDAVSSVLNGFVLNEVFSEDRQELLTMEDLLTDRVLVLAINELGTDEKLKVALITLFLNKYYEYMLRLPKWKYQGVNPQLRRLNSFVFVDEATNIMQHEFAVLEQLLLQGREFGVGVILASQYVGHFKESSVNYGETLLTKVVHKVPTATVRELRAFGFGSITEDQADRILGLHVHEAYCKTLGVDGRFMRGTPYFELVQQDS